MKFSQKIQEGMLGSWKSIKIVFVLTSQSFKFSTIKLSRPPTAKCTDVAGYYISVNCSANYQAEYHSESSLQLTLALKKTWIINPSNPPGFVDAWFKVPGREPEWSWHNPLKTFLPPFQNKENQ